MTEASSRGNRRLLALFALSLLAYPILLPSSQDQAPVPAASVPTAGKNPKHKLVIREVGEKTHLVVSAPVLAIDLMLERQGGTATKGTIIECEIPDPDKLPSFLVCDDGGRYAVLGILWADK